MTTSLERYLALEQAVDGATTEEEANRLRDLMDYVSKYLTDEDRLVLDAR